MKLLVKIPSMPSKLWVYVLTFLVPLTVRLIPEVVNPYMLGPDTPSYILIGELAAENWAWWRNVFYAFLGALSLAGVNLALFMKMYPAAIFALTVFLLSLYAERIFAKTPLMLLITSFTLSISPAFLRMSWDLHRQNFALVFLAFLLLLDVGELNWKKYGLSLALLALLGLSHEMVFGIAIVILLYYALRQALGNDWKGFLTYLSLSLTPILAYVLALLAVSGRIPNILGILFVSDYTPFLWGVDYRVSGPVDWWVSALVISVGLFLPISVLGFFHDHNLTPWLALTLVGYSSYIISPLVSLNLPERWLLLASLPLALYSANFLTKKRSLVKTLILLSLLSLQGFSMIGTFQSPLAVYAGQRYATMIDTLSTPESPETISSLQGIADWIRTNTNNSSVIIAPYELTPYTRYLLGPNFIVVAQDSRYVKNLIGSFVNGSEVPPMYYITYAHKSQYPLPYLEKVTLRPVHLLYPLILYNIIPNVSST